MTFAPDPRYAQIRALFPIPPQTVEWVVRQDSAVTTLHDLAGQNFISGAKGSVAERVTTTALQVLGLEHAVQIMDIAAAAAPEALKANVQNGFPVAPRFSVAADPEAAATSPIVSVVDRLAKRNLLKGWPRPPVPEYLSLEAILGEEIHKALRGETTNKQALANAQARADHVMRDAGYY